MIQKMNIDTENFIVDNCTKPLMRRFFLEVFCEDLYYNIITNPSDKLLIKLQIIGFEIETFRVNELILFTLRNPYCILHYRSGLQHINPDGFTLMASKGRPSLAVAMIFEIIEYWGKLSSMERIAAIKPIAG